ncbi:MAG TPA: GntR family transcriptional regulator [Terrimesophilobacter sp.]|jgi:Transcriptional regulators|uniref:GntR family transcriptional regulator n=1 Tax=Terrimesophilobacter sp. TaxID=2906435 RepID=UPI002F941EDC
MAPMEMFSLGRSAAGLDRESPSALHSQISDAMRSTIVSGEWPPHHRLKSEPELAVDLGVSRGTLRRALSTLIEEGLLKQIQGRGTFVTETLLEPAAAQKLSTLSEDFASQGVTLDTAVIEAALVEPPAYIGALLRVPGHTKVLRLVRVRRTSELPIALLHNYVRTDLAPGIEDIDFSSTSLFGTLEGRFRLKIGTARRTFSAQAASAEVSSALEVPVSSPVQYLEQLTFLSDGRPVEYSDVWINSSELRVVTLLARR